MRRRVILFDVDGTLVQTLVLVPDENGDAEAIGFLANAATGSELRIRAETDIRFGGAGSLTVEVAELLEMKPDKIELWLPTIRA